MTTSFTYNDVNQLKAVAIKNVSGTTLASYAYTLSATGNRTGVTEGSGRTIAWTYDKLYRLTSETISGAATANGAISYTYDAVGNRLTRTSTVPGIAATTTTYDANDRTVGDAWNDNGNMLTREGRNQSFDSLDRLVSSAPTSGGTTVKVHYDGDGNRVAVDVGGVLMSYLVDSENPTGYAQVVEERLSGVVTKAYVFGRKALSQRSKSGTSWTTNYYGMDGHGSVVLLTDAAGVVTDTWEYDAFGTVIARTGTTSNTILYSGEWFDSEQGLQYLRARWYAPGMGRFVSADTWEHQPGRVAELHRYVYALNAPVDRGDPSGNMSTLSEIPVVRYAQALIAASTPVIATRGQAIINSARSAVSSVPRELFEKFKCVECAEAIVAELKAASIAGEQLIFRAGRGDFMINELIGTGTTITRTGYHHAVRVGPMIYDNFFPQGVHFQLYLQSLVAQGGVFVTAKPF